MRTGLQKHFRPVDQPFRVAAASGLEFLDRSVATRTPLDANLGLWLQPMLRRELDQGRPVIRGYGEKSRRELEHVESHVLARCEVLRDNIARAS